MRMLYEVILDSGETPNKCTIAPLESRTDFRLIRVSNILEFEPLSSNILLHPDGICLSEFRNSPREIKGIACIDCIWRRLPSLIRRLSTPIPQLVKIPSGFVTAYPRKSTDPDDPAQGLATIEAIFIASALLGNWDPSLLSQYYFGKKFVELNAVRLRDLGVAEASDPRNFPPQATFPKNSEFKRWKRGKTRVLSKI